MSECRQFNMLCGSQSKFVQVQQFFYGFIIDNWWLVGSSKCYIYFAKCCGQFVLKFSTEVLCQGRLFCLNFSQNILNSISTCILEKWAKARMSSLICSFLLFTLDGVASFWILDNVVVSSIMPWTSIFGFYWLADSQIQVFIKVRSVIDKLFLKLPLIKNEFY